MKDFKDSLSLGWRYCHMAWALCWGVYLVIPPCGIAVGSNPPRRVLTPHIQYEATQLIRNQAAQLYLAGNKGHQPWVTHTYHTESNKEKSLLGASARHMTKRMANMLATLTEKLPNLNGLTHTSSATAPITEGCQEGWENQQHEICSF